MAPEKGAEQPLDTWARYRNNINDWYREMKSYGLNEDDINWLSNHSAITNGICESQEGLMSLLQEERHLQRMQGIYFSIPHAIFHISG